MRNLFKRGKGAMLKDRSTRQNGKDMVEMSTDIEPINYECVWYPKQSFEWWDTSVEPPKLIGEYHVGNRYNCTRFDVHEKLRFALANWLKHGLVRIVPLEADQRFVMTQYEVKT